MAEVISNLFGSVRVIGVNSNLVLSWRSGSDHLVTTGGEGREFGEAGGVAVIVFFSHHLHLAESLMVAKQIFRRRGHEVKRSVVVIVVAKEILEAHVHVVVIIESVVHTAHAKVVIHIHIPIHHLVG